MMYENSDEFFQFMECVKSGKIEEADSKMKYFNAEFKGKAPLFGVLMLKDKAPSKWIDYASKLLFIHEKPFLKSLKSKAVL